MAEFDPSDWQSNKTLAETNEYMWTNKIDCDVTFLVGEGEEKVEAHKYILISRSTVFYTMFKGSLPVDPDKPLRIPDIQPDIFKQLLLYLYTGTVQITLDNVLALLHASKIYIVQGLINKCLQRLKSKMLSTNLCLIMEAAHVYGENELRDMCRTGILRNPKQVLPLESLAELCSDCLESVIKDNKLQMEEEELFECIVKYSEEKCRKDMLPVTPENQRLVLGKALQQIRFTQMNQEYFSDKVEPLGILTHSESKAVINYFLKPRTAVQPPFNMALRECHRIVIRFETHTAGWTYNYRNQADAIMFECDHDVQLHGVLTYGSSDGPKEFDARVTVLDANMAPNIMQVFKIKSDGQTKYYDCLFNNPVQIFNNRKFTIMLEINPGKTTFSGEDGQERVEKNGVTFKFTNSTLSLNNTRISRGQIPGLIFKVVNQDIYSGASNMVTDNV